MRDFYTKMRLAGWCDLHVMVQCDLLDALHARAQELRTTTRLIVLTAIHLGLQRLRPSDVMAMENRWHGFVGLPAHELSKRGLMKRDPKTGRNIGVEPINNTYHRDSRSA